MEISIGVAIIFILWGLILIIKRKIMISEIIFNLLNFGFTTFVFLHLQNRISPIGVAIISMIIIIFNILIYKGKYIIFGVHCNSILPILKDVLKEENISYEEKEYFVQLTDYDDKCIFYNQSFDSVSIDLNEIRNLSLYENIAKELKNRISEIDLKLFPTMATIYITGGLSILVILKLILSM